MTVLDPRAHALLGWRRQRRFGFARRVALQPIAAEEIPRVAQSIPVAFRRNDQRWEAVAVLGPVHGTNVHVAADGRWCAGYVPAALRVFPFALVDDGGGLRLWDGVEPQPLDGDDVLPFFAGDVFADEVARIEAFLVKLRCGIAAVGPALVLLDDHGLLTPWRPHDVETIDERMVLAGLHAIDRSRFEALGDDAWLALRKLGAIGWIHAHLESLSHVDRFEILAKRLVDSVKALRAEIGKKPPLASFLDAISADLGREE